MAHVRDVDAHHERAFRRGLDVDRVVKVLRVAPVHREDVELAQVQATYQRLGRNPGGDGICLLQHVRRELAAQPVLHNHRFGLGGRVVLFAQHADDLAEDLVLAGLLGPIQLGHDPGTAC